MIKPEIEWSDFEKIDMRLGTIIKVEDFPEARKQAYKVFVDFGEKVGIKKTSAQITVLYSKEELVGKQVMGVLNFPVKQIGPFRSEFLLTGFLNNEQEVILASAEKPCENGAKLA